MLTIRPEQMSLLERLHAERATRRTVDHLRARFPQEFAELGEDGARELVEYAARGLARYVIRSDADRICFVEIMLLFGRDFDRDPALPWAAHILRQRKDPAIKLKALYTTVLERWDKKIIASAQRARAGKDAES